MSSPFALHCTSSRLPGQELQLAPIGIFDSGVGGLTVLRELYRQLPHESIVYFGDTARLPYGTLSQSQILQFVREILNWMLQQRVKMVIMACNTSSALALETVRLEFPVPILGVILPGAKAAVQQGQRIGVIATQATVISNAYRRAMLEIDPTVRVWQVSCPELVPLIEQNRINDPYTSEVTKYYLSSLLQQQIDTLVFGCTHYPHIEPIVRSLLPASVRLVDPAIHVVESAVKELDMLGLASPQTLRETRFCVSGSPQKFAHSCIQWIGYMPEVESVSWLEARSPVVRLESLD